MARRQEICDSDEEASDFSPTKCLTPLKVSDAPATEQVDATNSGGTISTDPSFFRKVYEDQQNAALIAQDASVSKQTPRHVDQDVVSTGLARPAPDATPQIGRTEAQDSWTATSITDPVPASQTRRKHYKQDDDRTQVTTPKYVASSAKDDVWDVPSSAVAPAPTQAAPNPTGCGRTGLEPLKNYGKRKRSSQPGSEGVDPFLPDGVTRSKGPVEDSPNNSPSHEVYDAGRDVSALPAGKKRKMDTQASAAEEVDMTAIRGSVEADGSNLHRRQSTATSSAIARNTSTWQGSTLPYARQSELTANQKRGHKIVVLLSAQDVDKYEMSLPEFVPQHHSHKSSGTTTIAYTTPSRFASSGPRDPHEAVISSGTRTSQRDIGGVVVDQAPASSPDIIATISTGKLGESASTPPGMQSSPYREIRSGSSTSGRKSRATKNRKAKGHNPREDPSESGEIGLHQECYDPRLSRRRANPAVADGDEDLGIADTHPDAIRLSASPANKPPESIGRLHLGDMVMNSLTEGGFPAEVDVKPKKRGRKKKQGTSIEPIGNGHLLAEVSSGNNKAVADVANEEQAEPARRKRGRPRKTEPAKTPILPADTPGANISARGGEYEDRPPHPVADVCISPGPRQGPPRLCGTLTAEKKQPGKKRGVPERVEALTEGRTVDSPADGPLEEISLNSPKTAASPDADMTIIGDLTASGEETKENKAAANQRFMDGAKGVMTTPANTAQNGKAPLRVGLSKRSRIAPLLKSIRR